jgi:hypothetical protein
MDPDPLRLLETAHSLRFGSISQGPPKPRFRIRPNCRLKRPPKLVNKTVNNFIKIVDGPTQMSRRRRRLGIEAVRQDGRGMRMEKTSGGRFARTIRKTAEDEVRRRRGRGPSARGGVASIQYTKRTFEGFTRTGWISTRQNAS